MTWRHRVIFGSFLLVVVSCSPDADSKRNTDPGPSSTSKDVSQTALKLVQTTCSADTPKTVDAVFPGASHRYSESGPGGPSCAWSIGGESPLVRALLIAYEQGDLASWRQLNPGPTRETTIAGKSVVVAENDTGCATLFEVDGTVVSIDFAEIGKEACARSTELTEEVLAGW
nr:DUF3558 family protein [Amycolatopsis aidingensis]